jgi:hypothetical protein
MFDRLDANHDGSLTKAEFIAGHDHRPKAAMAPSRTPRRPEGESRGRLPRPRPGPGGHRGPHGMKAVPGMMAFSPMVFDPARPIPSTPAT